MNKSVKNNVENIRALHKKGLDLQQEGSQEKAILYFDRIIKIEPCNCEFLYDKAVSLQMLHKLDDAIDQYDKVLRL